MSDKKQTKESIVQNLPWMPYNPWSGQGLFSDQWMTGAWGYAGVNPYSLAARYDDGSGMLRPVYITNFQKKQITDSARQLFFFNEYAAACVKIMQDFVVGTGFEYRVQATKDGVNNKLIQQAQELIDLFCEHNNIYQFENDVVWRLLVEGEIITRLFYDRNGLITIRQVEPELLLPPADTNNPDVSYAIQTRDDDIHDVVGYWIVEKPWEGLVPILVDAAEVNYLKINSPSNAKRGLPMSFQVDSNFRNCESVLQSMISLANARSKVAMVRKISEAPPEAVDALRERTSDITLNDPITNQRLNIERMPYGTILTSSENISYEFPDIGSFAEECKETLQTNLRAICAHYGISEIQLSQNITTRTYASANVAESPASKNYIRWQKMIGEYIAGRRTKPHQSIMWKQIMYAVKRGLLPENALTDIRITYRGPSVITRDIYQEAKTNQVYVDMGIKSKEAVSAELGMDYEQQKKNKLHDDSLDNILDTVTKITKSGVSSEGAKVLIKKYHPSLDDEIINTLFQDMNNNNAKQEEPKAPKVSDEEPKPRPEDDE